MRLSFVIPVYNEAPTIGPLVEGILSNAGTGDLEILIIDDGSTDDTRSVLAEVGKAHPEIVPIYFEINRGKTQALKAGFESARGEVVVTMDGDLQDDPAEIPALLARLGDGCDVVCGWKEDRKDSRTRVRASWVYNWFVRALFGLPLRDVNCGFKAMRLEVAKSLVPYLERDYHRLIPVIAHRCGHRVCEVAVAHHSRRHGESKYGPSRYLRALRDVVLLRFTPRPRV